MVGSVVLATLPMTLNFNRTRICCLFAESRLIQMLEWWIICKISWGLPISNEDIFYQSIEQFVGYIQV